MEGKVGSRKSQLPVFPGMEMESTSLGHVPQNTFCLAGEPDLGSVINFCLTYIC